MLAPSLDERRRANGRVGPFLGEGMKRSDASFIYDFSVMRPRILAFRPLALALALACAALPALADKKPPQMEKPMAGPRATALRVTWLYISPDTSSQKVDRVQIGREMVVAERSGPWLRVYANTDIQETRQKDAPHRRPRRSDAAHLRLDGRQGNRDRNHAGTAI